MLRTMRLPSMITNCLNIFVSCLIRLVWLCSNYWKYTSEKTEDIGYIIDCPSFVYISFLRRRRSFRNVLLYLASLSHYSSDHVGVNIYFIILCIHWRGFSYIAMVKWSKLKFHSGGISLNVCINSLIFLILKQQEKEANQINISKILSCRFTKYHITNKCTNCISFILKSLFFKTLSLLLHVSITYRLSSSGSTYSS